MARKKAAHSGGHGWFVTFADLMALLMSTFVILLGFSTQDQKKLQIVAGSMREAFGTQRDHRYAGILESDGLPTRPHLKHAKIAPPEEGSEFTAPPTRFEKRDDGISLTAFDRSFALAAVSLRQALQDMPEIAELSKNIIIEETREGLNISLVDQDGRAMFPDASAQPYERFRRLLERMAPTLRRMPNRIAVTGYTAAQRPGTSTGWSSWELSTARASATREVLAASGLSDDRFASVTGKADTEPLFPDNPYIAANRRVSVVLLKEAPPLPANAKP